MRLDMKQKEEEFVVLQIPTYICAECQKVLLQELFSDNLILRHPTQSFSSNPCKFYTQLKEILLEDIKVK